MERYANRSGSSGVSGYEIGSYYIWVEFTTGSIYEYTYSSAGTANIETMKGLAKNGSGLNSFINTNVKKRYSRRIR